MIEQVRILAVDDTPQNILIIEETLDQLYQIRTASSGPDALSIAASFKPDIVLLDVMMDPMDGYETCKALRKMESLQATKIVFVSARTEMEDRRIGYFAGGDDYLTKPFSQEELIAKIEATKPNTSQSETDDIPEKFEAFVDSTGGLLTFATSFSSPESTAHLALVSGVCRFIAMKAEESPEIGSEDGNFVAKIVSACVLHDVGMTCLPRSLVNCNRSLTSEEAADMQRHTVLGEYLLRSLSNQNSDEDSFYSMAAAIARWHHENWDGTGYPDGRSGENIPLSARIMRFADIFDEFALQCRIPGRKCTAKHLVTHLDRHAGKALDPHLVSLGIANIDFLMWLAMSRQDEESIEAVRRNAQQRFVPHLVGTL